MPATTADHPARVRRTPTRRALSAGLIVIVAGAGMLTAVLRSGMLDGADRAAAAAAQGHQPRWLHALMAVVSLVGGSTVVAVALLAVAALRSWRSWRWAPLLISAAALVLFGGVVAAGKGFLGTGPAWIVDIGDVQGPAFPCGPATASVVTGGVALLLLHDRVGRRIHTALCTVVATGALAVGAAQVYLGHHQLSDVAASWVLGAALLSAVTLITRRCLARHPLGQP